MTFANLSLSQQIACRQLTSHITAWAAIPLAMTTSSPIAHVADQELTLPQRLAQFATQVRTYERTLLTPLKVSQPVLDYFTQFDSKYPVAFSQSDALWLNHDCRQQLIWDDMNPLSVSLRSLESALTVWGGSDAADNDDVDPLSIGREVNTLRRIIASRAGWAEEVAQLIPEDPCEAVRIFYDQMMRALREVQPMTGALSLYHRRRPSSLPPFAG